jgi:hypothetical protein
MMKTSTSRDSKLATFDKCLTGSLQIGNFRFGSQQPYLDTSAFVLETRSTNSNMQVPLYLFNIAHFGGNSLPTRTSFRFAPNSGTSWSGLICSWLPRKFGR